jgi:G3E family GTPase
MIVDIVFGFLGAGKTTFITRVLREWEANEKTVVLVNEFGDVGIDGDLLAMQGGNVVEMPSGCICCTLQADFKAQMLDIMNEIKPERLIIEPTGVATISQVRSIVELQVFEEAVKGINEILIADAHGFMDLYKANRHFVESQIENAHIVVLNKCDKVEKRKAMLTRSAITAINPDISVLTAEYGAVDRAEYQLALAAAPRSASGLATGRDPFHNLVNDHSDASTDGRHVHFHEEADALGYESFGRVFTDLSFDPDSLEAFFQEMNGENADTGDIVRAKGIFRTGDKGLLMELASGELSSQPTGLVTQSKASIIGKDLNRDKISAALERCAMAV